MQLFILLLFFVDLDMLFHDARLQLPQPPLHRHFLLKVSGDIQEILVQLRSRGHGRCLACAGWHTLDFDGVVDLLVEDY